MLKQFILAMLATATLFTFSCKKDETCAKCELREYCVRCDDNNGGIYEVCGDEQDAESYRSSCIIVGGTATVTNTLNDTRELCDEDNIIVNSFMDGKVADGYKCEYVD